MEAFSGKRVLLLQGPVGPFFARLARDLEAVGATVFKINFNAGDWLFYPGGISYRGTMDAWPAWIEARLRALRIDTLFLFGDCRPIHRSAHAVAMRLGVEVGVFEEGYLRPDYVTLERHGVNGHSRMPRDPDAYRRDVPEVPARQPVPRTFWPMVWFGLCYFAAGALGRIFFPYYRHHRPLSLLEGWPWFLSPIRKLWYRYREAGMEARLAGAWSGRYFLVPLQVFNDAQVTHHADVGGVAGFIATTIDSFGRCAPPDRLLVFKHHPMDRGYVSYRQLIDRHARAAGVADRVFYIHDQYTPLLLAHAVGVVVINSTVGLSALGHGIPTKTCGDAIYDMPGLTYQGELDAFWGDAPDYRPDRKLFLGFRSHLIARTQLNGSFYRRLPLVGSAAGLVWAAERRRISSGFGRVKPQPLRNQPL